MDNILKYRSLFKGKQMKRKSKLSSQNDSSFVNKNSLAYGEINREYTIQAINTGNDEMQDFLFTLGCYEGEKITILSILADHYVIVIKDARYSISKELAGCIII